MCIFQKRVVACCSNISQNMSALWSIYVYNATRYWFIPQTDILHFGVSWITVNYNRQIKIHIVWYTFNIPPPPQLDLLNLICSACSLVLWQPSLGIKTTPMTTWDESTNQRRQEDGAMTSITLADLELPPTPFLKL